MGYSEKVKLVEHRDPSSKDPYESTLGLLDFSIPDLDAKLY